MKAKFAPGKNIAMKVPSHEYGRTDDLSGASETLAANECSRCDGIERLPDGLRGFWVASPANIIHLLVESTPHDGG